MKYIANLKDNGTDCIRTGYEETLEGTREECMRDYLYHIRINCGMEEITEADVDLVALNAFPIITKSLQEAYEQGTKGSQDKTPEICGCYGRACRQMDKTEGANRALCMDCGLAEYCGQ